MYVCSYLFLVALLKTHIYFVFHSLTKRSLQHTGPLKIYFKCNRWIFWVTFLLWIILALVTVQYFILRQVYHLLYQYKATSEWYHLPLSCLNTFYLAKHKSNVVSRTFSVHLIYLWQVRLTCPVEGRTRTTPTDMHWIWRAREDGKVTINCVHVCRGTCCHTELPRVLCASDIPSDFRLVINLVTLKFQQMAFSQRNWHIITTTGVRLKIGRPQYPGHKA